MVDALSIIDEKKDESFPEWGTDAWFKAQFANHTGDSASYYGHALNGYQRYRHAIIVELIKKTLVCFRPQIVLDVGCALGDLGRCVQDLYPEAQVVGIDFVPEVVQRAATLNPRNLCSIAGLPSLPFKDCVFDFVLLSEVLYYLEATDRKMALKNIWRSMKSGAMLLFSSPLDDGEKYFSHRGAIDLLESHFWVREVVHGHNRAYHWLESRLLRLIVTRDWFRQRAPMPTRKPLWRDLLILIRNTPFFGAAARLFLEAASRPAKSLLSLAWLPGVMSNVSMAISGREKVTNIFVIAEKR